MRLKKHWWIIALAVLLIVVLIVIGFSRRNSGPTVRNFLRAAMEPVGKCLYVFGGGWDENGKGGAEETRKLGASPNWYAFFKENGADYNYKRAEGHYHDGLDCSGYIGYSLYQIFQDKYSKDGYVVGSSEMPETYAEMFKGTVIPADKITEYRPGDIMGTKGHVCIAIGTCDDGSLVFLHASPPVVSICGTPTPAGDEDSMAIRLAERYMKKYFPECSEKYQNWSRGTNYLTNFRLMRWNREVMTDPDGFDRKSPEAILRSLLGA